MIKKIFKFSLQQSATIHQSPCVRTCVGGGRAHGGLWRAIEGTRIEKNKEGRLFLHLNKKKKDK